MNFLPITKQGDRMSFGADPAVALPATMQGLADGTYTAGFRPNHLALHAKAAHALCFQARLAVTEITGSETFVHLDCHGARWVGLIHGIHDLDPGVDLNVYLDPAHIYVFSLDGALVASAPYSEAA